MYEVENSSILKFTNVAKFFGSKKILDNISFEFNKGDIVGLVGPNGAGKTTIMRLILGSIKRQDGNIILFDKLVKNEERRESNLRIGFVLEKSGFDYHKTGLENIYYYSKIIGIEKEVAEKRTEKLKNELGFNFYLTKPLNTYSKGMVKKLSILQSLLNKPELLILDEPISDVDQETKNTIVKLILYLSEVYKITILISSHNLGDLEDICRKYIIINNGKLEQFEEKDNIDGSELTLIVKIRGNINGTYNLSDLINKGAILDYKRIPTGFIFDIPGKEAIDGILKFFEENHSTIYNYEISKCSLIKKYFELVGDNAYDKEFNIF